MIKKVVCFLGTMLYGALFASVLYSLFHFLTPWLMSWGWTAVALYWIFALGFISSVLSTIFAFISIPFVYMIPKCKIARYIPIFFLITVAYNSIISPWQLDIEYTVVKYVIAFSISSTAFAAFLTAISILFGMDDKDIILDEDAKDASQLGMSVKRYKLYKEIFDEQMECHRLGKAIPDRTDEIPNMNEWRKYGDHQLAKTPKMNGFTRVCDN